MKLICHKTPVLKGRVLRYFNSEENLCLLDKTMV